MLRKDVVEAVGEGRFHILTAATVEEGIELLTGVAAGAPDEEGEYDPGTVYGMVQKRLAKIAKDVRESIKSDKEESRNGLTASGQASP
jgi:hypothetical protein